MQFQILFIIFVAIFILSAVIVFLGITKIIQIDKKYLNPLFYSLIIEVIAAIIYLFYLYANDTYTKNEIDKLIEVAQIDRSLSENNKLEELRLIIEKSADLKKYEKEYQNEIKMQNEKIEKLNQKIKEKDSIIEVNYAGQTNFFKNINTLKNIFNKHNVNWFYLTSNYTRNNANDIYQVISSLINEIGVYNDPDTDIETITNSWQKFISNYRSKQKHNISQDPDKHILRSDIAYILKEKIKIDNSTVIMH